MDHAERLKLKQLANDSIIATFGQGSNEAKLAQELESTVDELTTIATECEHCKYCDIHGEVEDDSIAVDVNELLRIHGELKKQLKAFKDYHVDLSGKLAEWADTERFTEPLAEIIGEAESYVDELGAEVLP